MSAAIYKKFIEFHALSFIESNPTDEYDDMDLLHYIENSGGPLMIYYLNNSSPTKVIKDIKDKITEENNGESND